MKRKVLFFFSFLLILLVFFTFISPKVEDEMITLADARKGMGQIRNHVVSTIAIKWKDSKDTFFNISEGSGWEQGLRIFEIPPEYYDLNEDFGYIELGAGTEYWYVYSASREPVLGGAVRDVDMSKGKDTYLIWHPEEISELNLYRLPNSMEVLSKADKAALIDCSSATFPFFEHNIWYTLRDVLGEDIRVYSLHDIEQFTSSLPWIAGVFAILLCSLILWASTWLLFSKVGCGKKILFVNIFLIAGLLLLLPLILNQFDLPASLMPPESILDITYYTDTFSRVTTYMSAMNNSMVHEWLSQAKFISIIVIAVSVTIICAILIIELKLSSKQRILRKRKNSDI